MNDQNNQSDSVKDTQKKQDEGNATDTTQAATKVQASIDEDNLLESATGDLKGLASALEEAKAKAEENWNTYLRARADMENVRRRAQIDVENAHKYGIERFAREMLSVIDSLEHGLQVADSVKDTVYHEGMELTQKLCMDTFEKFGIKRIEPAIGETFDPLRHEAISAQVSTEIDPNKVMIVAQRGFMLHDRVLRPARVIVSRKE